MSEVKAQVSKTVLDHVDGWMSGLGHVISNMAQQLGVAAGHVYEVYTKQQFAEGLTDVIIYGVLLTAVIWAYVFVWKITSDFKYTTDMWGSRTGGFIVLLIAGGMFISKLRDGMLHLINPEYYAIQSLIDMVKNITQ